MLLTNNTAQTPLGFGPIGVTIEPGQSATVTAEQFAQLEAHPVIAGWIEGGMVGVAPDAVDSAALEAAAKLAAEQEAEAKRLADEAAAAEAEAAKLAAEVKVEPPKVPTPTKR